MSLLRLYDPHECDARGVPLGWERCRCSVDGADDLPEGYVEGDGHGRWWRADCEFCAGHGSLRSVALFETLAARGAVHTPDPAARARCEDCGHPAAPGTWDPKPRHDDHRRIAERAAAASFSLAKEPIPGQPVFWSLCDEVCRHSGPGRMDGPGGPNGTNLWLYFGADTGDGEWKWQVTPTLAAGLAVEASWRPVDVRPLGWAHDLRPEKLAVLCMRCLAIRLDDAS